MPAKFYCVWVQIFFLTYLFLHVQLRSNRKLSSHTFKDMKLLFAPPK